MNIPEKEQDLDLEIGSVRRNRKMPLLLALAAIFAASPLQAAFIANMLELGNNVVVTGNGNIILPASFNTNGFHQIYTPELVPNRAEVYLGGLGQVVGLFNVGFSGPSSIGPGSMPSVPSFGGDPVGVGFVPWHYFSGSPLSTQNTFSSATFASLGVTPGTYIWTWQTDHGSDTFTLNIGVVPEPSTTTLVGLAACAVWCASLVRRLRGKIVRG
jgi:hypothetical protein